MNEQITVPEVMLVTEGQGTETLPTAEALARAKVAELDLIEVSPKARPPVVKIADFGHYLYQIQKKEKRQRAHGKHVEVKTLRFGFRTDRHDLDRILTRAREFLAGHHLVKFAVRLRGREFTNQAYAVTKMRNLLKELQDVAELEQDIKKHGNQYIAVLRPKH